MARALLLSIVLQAFIGSLLEAVETVLPADGDTLTAIQVLFQWPPDPQADHYELEITRLGGITGPDSTFAPIAVDEASAVLGYIFEFGRSYSWRRRAIDEGNPAAWGISKTFHIKILPLVPNIKIAEYNALLYQPGLTFVNRGNIGWAIDQKGKVMLFHSAPANLWNINLLPNGNLLYIAGEADASSKVFEASLNGKQTYFSSPEGYHHHYVYPMLDGGCLALQAQGPYLPLNGFEGLVKWIGDRVVHYDSTGAIIWTWSAFDHLYYGASTDVDSANIELAVKLYDSKVFHWTHGNASFYDASDNSVILSLRNLSRVVKIDYDSGDIIWSMGAKMQSGEVRMGNGLFSYQHAAKALANGNILLYDNRGFSSKPSTLPSRALEIAFYPNSVHPDSAYIAWKFDLDVFTPSFGDVDRLPNGNTLIMAGNQPANNGTAWEVDYTGNVAWKATMNFPSYQAERVPGLYPRAFAEDSINPIFRLTGPQLNSAVNTPRVSYNLSETLLSGRITFTRTGGASDPASPHTQVLYGAELNAGEHKNILLTESPSLVDGAAYSVTFEGEDFAGNESARVENTGVLYDVTGPGKVKNTSARAGDRRIYLKWSANPEGDLGHYLVYRNTTSSFASAVLVAQIAKPDTAAIDSGLVNTKTYFYWIAAVDTAGNAGSPSSAVYGIPGTPPVLSAFPDTSFLEDGSLTISRTTLFSHVQDNETADSTLTWEFQSKYQLVTVKQEASGLTLSASADKYGLDSLTVIVTDPSDLSDTTRWSVRVTAVNDPPVISGIPDTVFMAGDSLTVHLDAFVSDVDDPDSNLVWSVTGNDTLAVSLIDSVRIAVVKVLQNWVGSENLIFTVSDTSGAADSDTVLVSVAASPIEFSAIPNTAFAEDDSLSVPFSYFSTFLVNNPTPDSLLAWKFIKPSGVKVKTVDRTVRLSAPLNWYGQGSISVIVLDPVGLRDTTAWRVRVLPVNDPPVPALPDTSFRINDSQTLFLDNYVTDPDSPDSTMKWQVFKGAQVSVEIDDSLRTATLRAPKDWIGLDRVIFRVTDDSLASALDTLNVTVYSSSTYLADRYEWQSGSEMPTPRQDFAVAVLNGEIYAIGGETPSGPTTVMEIYNPVSGRWRAGPPMQTARRSPAAAAVGGKLYAIGGYDTSVEAYDPLTNSWSYKAPLAQPKYGHEAVAADGKIYVIGGWPLSGTYVYDPDADKWVGKAPNPYIRGGSGTAVIDGKIYVAGGLYKDSETSESSFQQRLDVLDPTAGTWSQKASLNVARAWASASVIGGKLYLIGGEDAGGLLSSIEVYNRATDAWGITDSLSSPRGRLPALAPFIGKDLFVVGGLGSGGVLPDIAIKRDLSGVYYPPLVSAFRDTTIAEDDSLVVSRARLDSLVIDVESPDSLIVWDFRPADSLIVRQDARGLVIKGPPNWYGTDTLTVKVFDQQSLSDTTTWIIAVRAVNDPPILSGLTDTSFVAGDSLSFELDKFVLDVDDPDSSLVWLITGYNTIRVWLDPAARLALLKVNGLWLGTESLIFTAIDPHGARGRDTIRVTVLAPSGLSDRYSPEIPKEFSLTQNFPNPFNPETTIQFGLPNDSPVDLRIYNITGQLVRTLVEGRLNAGYHRVRWDSRDQSGREVGSGIYFYRIEAGKYSQTRRMVLLK